MESERRGLVIEKTPSSFIQNLVECFFPRFCLGCHREGELWCGSCASVWWPKPFIAGCPFCGDGLLSQTCRSCKKETFLDGLWAFASYGNPVVREAILQWKYVGDLSVETILQQWLVRAVPVFFEMTQDAVFAPVPLHIRKQRARGFDQAGMIADWCGQLCSRPVFDLLVRTQFTSPQAMRAQSERQLGTMDGIFSLHPKLDVVPKRVVLCDDVFTSGATMDSAARVLKEAGVEQVVGFVLAKGK